MSHLRLALAACLAAGPAWAQSNVGTHIDEYGVFAGDGPGDGDWLGSLTPTDHVVARPCTVFGIRYSETRLPSPVGVEVTVRITHPPITPPDGQVFTQTSSTHVVSDTPRSSGFEFSDAWEMVPGRWVFQLVENEAVVAEQAFEVVAAPGGTVSRPCHK